MITILLQETLFLITGPEFALKSVKDIKKITKYNRIFVPGSVIVLCYLIVKLSLQYDDIKQMLRKRKCLLYRVYFVGSILIFLMPFNKFYPKKIDFSFAQTFSEIIRDFQRCILRFRCQDVKIFR